MARKSVSEITFRAAPAAMCLSAAFSFEDFSPGFLRSPTTRYERALLTASRAVPPSFTTMSSAGLRSSVAILPVKTKVSP